MERANGWFVVCVDLRGPPMTDTQLLVLRNVAAEHLVPGKCGARIRFSHELCDGILERGSEGAYQGVLGTYYHAELVANERRTCDFFIPEGSETLELEEAGVVIGFMPLPGGIGREKEKIVDPRQARLEKAVVSSAVN